MCLLFSQGGQLVGLIPDLAGYHLIFVSTVCMLVTNKVLSL